WPVGGIGLGAGLVSGEDEVAVPRIVGAAVNLPRGRDLLGGETGRRILARRALHRGRIEAAIAGIIEEWIGRHAAVLTGALRERRLAEHRQQARRDEARRVLEERLLVPDEPGEEVGPEVGG